MNHAYGWDFKTAADEVRKVLGIGSGENSHFPANVVPITKPEVSKTQPYAESLWAAANNNDAYVVSHPYCLFYRDLVRSGKTPTDTQSTNFMRFQTICYAEGAA